VPKKTTSATSKKRLSLEPEPPPRKRRKPSPVSSPEDKQSSPLSELESEEIEEKPKKKPASKTSRKKAITKELGNDVDEEKTDESAVPPALQADDASGSELSVVLDAEPKKKRKSKDASNTKATKKQGAAKPKQDTEADPDQAEIRRLQGYLAKCGIRKVWGKELKPYESSRAKIKYLRDMLSEAGMTGRFSAEKAAQIKERRELAADIEAVQEGNERWGKGSADEDEDEDADDSRPKRRLVRGSKAYDFLSSDGEETD